METLKSIISWVRKHNEFTFIIALVIFVWKFAPGVFRAINPEAGEFGIEVLYIPFIALIFFLVGTLSVWIYLWLVWPAGYRLLDDIFNNENFTLWQRTKVLLCLFGSLVLLYAVALLSVTGISVIM